MTFADRCVKGCVEDTRAGSHGRQETRRTSRREHCSPRLVLTEVVQLVCKPVMDPQMPLLFIRGSLSIRLASTVPWKVLDLLCTFLFKRACFHVLGELGLHCRDDLTGAIYS